MVKITIWDAKVFILKTANQLGFFGNKSKPNDLGFIYLGLKKQSVWIGTLFFFIVPWETLGAVQESEQGSVFIKYPCIIHKESVGIFGSLRPLKLDHFGNLWPQK